MPAPDFRGNPTTTLARTSQVSTEPASVASIQRGRTESSEYRPDIDGLRAIAVVAVVAFHAFPEYVPGGFIGVDVFFVISGFLISGIILKHLAGSTFSFADFYARRARRILPALSVVLLACLLFGAIALLPDEFVRLGRETAAGAAFVANLAFWKESGYFAPAAESEPLLHLWSLGIEEQFYFVWPLVLALAWRFRVNILQCVAAITCGSFLLSVMLTRAHPTAGFYLPVSRFWELGLGCMVAAVQLSPIRRHLIPASAVPRWVRELAGFFPILGAALIVASAFCFDSHTPFPGIAASVPTLGAVCIVGARRHAWFSDRVLGSPALVFIGLISYSLYLWHWPIISFTAILQSGQLDVPSRLVGVVLSLVLAIVTYRYVESPIRKQRRGTVSVALVAGATALAALGVGVAMQQGFPGRFPVDVLAMRQGPKEDDTCLASMRGRPRTFNYCRQTRTDPPEVLFLGDSQAQGIYEGTVSKLGEHYSVRLLGRGGCPPLLHVPPGSGAYESDQERRSCNDTWSKFVEFVRDTRPPIVVLTGHGSRFFQTQSGDVPLQDWESDANARVFDDGLRDLVNALQMYSRVVYVLEIPTFDTGPDCFLRFLKLPRNQCSPQVSRSDLIASTSIYRSSVYTEQRQHPDMVVIDPVPALCTSSVCSQISRSGEVLYSDRMHLSPAGGRRFAQNSGLAQFIAEAISDARGEATTARNFCRYGSKQQPDAVIGFGHIDLRGLRISDHRLHCDARARDGLDEVRSFSPLDDLHG